MRSEITEQKIRPKVKLIALTSHTVKLA